MRNARPAVLPSPHPADPWAPPQNGLDGEHGPIIDQACHSSNLDELEDILNTLVSPQKLIPSSRGSQVDGAFRFRGMVDLGIFNVRFGRKIWTELPPEETDDRLAFVMTTHGRGQLHLGRREFPFSERSGVVFTSAPARALQFLEETENQVLIMDRRRISSYCAKLLGREVEGYVDFDLAFPLHTDAGQGWLRLLHYAAGEFSDPHSLVRQFPAARQQLEQMMITALLLGHRHNHSETLLQPQSAAAPFYVRRAEAYIEARYAEPLSLADIAAHAGVSARGLQNGFQNFRRMTPMAFLRSIRLQKAHQALLAADPAVSTVTGIALACGFGHLGEFATHYKRRYGTTPRQTLAKAV